MDPLSVTAAVTGFVSLGIQVVGGLATYLDAIKDRDSDLAAVNDRLQQLHRQIKTIESITEHLGVQHLEASDNVKHCIVGCQKQLEPLEEFLASIDVDRLDVQLGVQTTPVPKASKVKHAIKQLKKKGPYPFRRSKIQTLALRLDSSVESLQTALIVLDVFHSEVVNRSISELRSINERIGAKLELSLANTDLILRAQSQQIETVAKFLPHIEQRTAGAGSAIDVLGSGVKCAQESISNNVTISTDGMSQEFASPRNAEQESCQQKSGRTGYLETALLSLSSDSTAVDPIGTIQPINVTPGQITRTLSPHKASAKLNLSASQHLGASQRQYQCQGTMLAANSNPVVTDADIIGRIVRMELREQLEPVLNRFDGVIEAIDQVASAVAKRSNKEEVFQSTDTNISRPSGDSGIPDESEFHPIKMERRQQLHIEQSQQMRAVSKRKEVKLYTWSFSPRTGIGRLYIQVATYRICGSPKTYFRMKVVFIPKPWLLSRGLSIIYSSGPNYYGHYDLCPSIQPICFIPAASAVWRALEEDDASSLRRMFQLGEVSINDTTEAGSNLLQLAIMLRSSSISQYLLLNSGYSDFFLDVDDRTRGMYWLLLARPDMLNTNYFEEACDILRLFRDHTDLPQDLAEWSMVAFFGLVQRLLYSEGESSYEEAIYLCQLLVDTGAIIYPPRIILSDEYRDFEERVEGIKLYIELGGNPNYVSEYGDSLLHTALFRAHFDMVRLGEADDRLLTILISAGADIYYIWDRSDGGTLRTLTDCAYGLDIEDIWETALCKCGFDLDTVYIQSDLRLKEYHRLRGATRTGVDVRPLIDGITCSNIRYRGEQAQMDEDI